MQVCFFLFDQGSDIEVADAEAAARQTGGLRRLVVHQPMREAKGDPPSRTHATGPGVLQWYFDDVGQLEAALEADGPIQALMDRTPQAASGHSPFAQQVMAVRHFATPDARDCRAGGERCTYLVSYEGEADDLNAWLTHYMRHHPPLMAQLPAIRELEIYTRLDYRTGLTIPRSTAMQRNKVVFDDLTALEDALGSPARARMKQDFDAFPPYRGASPHYPVRSIYAMLT